MSAKSKRARRKRQRARQNLEETKLTTKINDPQATEQQHDSAKPVDTTGVATSPTGPTPTVTGGSRQQESKEPTQGSKPLVRPHITIRIGESKMFSGLMRFLDSHHGAITAIATIVIGILTYQYATYAKKQWQVMNATLLLERPWIGQAGNVIRTVGPTQPPEGQVIDFKVNKFFGMAVRIENGGRSPASKVRYHMELKLGLPYNPSIETIASGLPTDEVCDKGELGPEYGAGVLMSTPGVVTHMPAYTTTEIRDNFNEILDNTVGLYSVGCVDYSDSTGKPWYRTKLRLVFVPKDTDPFQMTKFGNDAW